MSDQGNQNNIKTHTQTAFVNIIHNQCICAATHRNRKSASFLEIMSSLEQHIQQHMIYKCVSRKYGCGDQGDESPADALDFLFLNHV